MSRRHRTRNTYPEGYAEHEVEMDWRKERDIVLDREDTQEQRAVTRNLFDRIETVTARAELAEHALIDTVSVRRARLYAALCLVCGVFIGYFLRLVTA